MENTTMSDNHKILPKFNITRKESDVLHSLKHAFDFIVADENDDKKIHPALHALHIALADDFSILINTPILHLERELQIDHESALKLYNELKGHFSSEMPLTWLKNLLLSTKNNYYKSLKAKENQLHGLEAAEQEFDTAERRKKKHLLEFKEF